MELKVISLEKYKNISANSLEVNKMGDLEESEEVSGLEVFLTRPETAGLIKSMLDSIENYVYHAIDFSASIKLSLSDKEFYELGRYVGKVQLLVNYGIYLVEHLKDENTAKKIAIKMFKVIDDITKIYMLLVSETDLNRYHNVFTFFKDNVNDLSELIFKYVHI